MFTDVTMDLSEQSKDDYRWMSMSTMTTSAAIFLGTALYGLIEYGKQVTSEESSGSATFSPCWNLSAF